VPRWKLRSRVGFARRSPNNLAARRDSARKIEAEIGRDSTFAIDRSSERESSGQAARFITRREPAEYSLGAADVEQSQNLFFFFSQWIQGQTRGQTIAGGCRQYANRWRITAGPMSKIFQPNPERMHCLYCGTRGGPEAGHQLILLEMPSGCAGMGCVRDSLSARR